MRLWFVKGLFRRAGAWRRLLVWSLLGAGLLLVAGFLVPENIHQPVLGAGDRDWNHRSFWYRPWGRSGVHKGIDIFAERGRPVRSATRGLVVGRGSGSRGGKTVLVLGPKWRFHYYAHLNRVVVRRGQWIGAGRMLGTVGNTGNAAGKQPHLHYAICSAIPYPWQWRQGPQGWKRMFFLDPHQKLIGLTTHAIP